MYLRSHKVWCGIALALLSLGSTAPAVVLDWDAVTWTPGYSNSFDVDAANPGNDITVSISGDTSTLQYGTPARTTNFEGGLGVPENTLALAVDFTSKSQFITVTIDFSSLYSAGVQNVSFTIFDVDFDNQVGTSEYQDQLRLISALSINGVTQIAPTITTSPNNTRSGNGVNQVVNGALTTVDSGPGSGAGNVTISFGGAAIKSLTFRYGSGPTSPTNPTYQHIAIHDLSFTPVPEINPAWTAMISCFVAAGLVLRHRALCRKK
jgi:hypothetical protein